MAPADAGDTESLVPQPDREPNADRARGPVPPDLHGAAAEEQGHGAPGRGEVSNEVRTRRRRGILQPLRRGRASSPDVAGGRSRCGSTLRQPFERCPAFNPGSTAAPADLAEDLRGDAGRPLPLEIVQATIPFPTLRVCRRHCSIGLAQALPQLLDEAETLLGAQPLYVD